MGFRIRKSFGSGPLRVNVSKSGVGFSAGAKGYRVTKKAGGGTRTTASIPGTGISYVSETKGKMQPSAKSPFRPEVDDVIEPISTRFDEKTLRSLNDKAFLNYVNGYLLWVKTEITPETPEAEIIANREYLSMLRPIIKSKGIKYNKNTDLYEAPRRAGCLSMIVAFLLTFFGIGLLFNACGSNDDDVKPLPSESPSQSQTIVVDTDAVAVIEERLTGLGFRADAVDSGRSHIDATAYLDAMAAEQRPVNWPEVRDLVIEASLELKGELDRGVVIYVKDEVEDIVLTVIDGRVSYDAYPDEPEPSESAEPSESPDPSDEPSPSASASVRPSSSTSKSVWIPQSGTKYHSKASCSGMENPSLIDLADAIAQGYTACKRCH